MAVATEHAEKVKKAQDLLFASIKLLREVAYDTNDENARSYIIDHLRILAGKGHGFCARDQNLDDWIVKLTGEETEES